MSWYTAMLDPDLNTLLIVTVIGWMLRHDRRITKLEFVVRQKLGMTLKEEN